MLLFIRSFLSYLHSLFLMHVFIERSNITKKKNFKGKVSSLLKQLEINPEEVLVTRNNELVTETDTLKDNDTVKILSVNLRWINPS